MSAAGIAVQRVRLVVVAAKNVVERVAAEAGQRDLPTIFHVAFLVDVVLGHGAAALGSDARWTKCAIRTKRANTRYINAQTDVEPAPQVDSIPSRDARSHSDPEVTTD